MYVMTPAPVKGTQDGGHSHLSASSCTQPEPSPDDDNHTRLPMNASHDNLQQQHHPSSMPIMLTGLIHRVEDVMGSLPPTLEDMQEDENHDRDMTLLSTTTKQATITPTTTTTTTTSNMPTATEHPYDHYDRRPTPMQISPPPLPLKSMATTTTTTVSSSSSSSASSSTVSSSLHHKPMPTFYERPAFVKDSSSLHHLSRAKIDEFLQPMLQSLTELDAEALLQLQRVAQGGAQVVPGARIQPIHTQVSPPQPLDCVRYLHIAEVPDQYSIGIFIFPPNAKIPLHDHPGMCVLSRILYGEVSRVSLDLLEESEEVALEQQLQQQSQEQPPSTSTTTPKSWFQNAVTWQPPQSLLNMFPSDATVTASGMPHISTTSSSSTNANNNINNNSTTTKPRRRLAMMNGVDRLVAPQVTSLYPYEGNLHEFTAGPEGAAVLDVLLPPYGQEDCTFYDIEPLSNNIISNNSTERRPCWIVPTGQPEEFHCLSGRYLNIGSSGSSGSSSSN